MKAYKKQIQQSKVEPTPEPAKEPVKEPVKFSGNQEARVKFMRDIIANARVRM